MDSNSLFSFGSSDSLLAESLQLDFEDNDSIWGGDDNFLCDPVAAEPTLESVLNSDFETESDICPSSLAPTPTPSVIGGVDDLVTPQSVKNSILRNISLNNLSVQLASASVSFLNANHVQVIRMHCFIGADQRRKCNIYSGSS